VGTGAGGTLGRVSESETVNDAAGSPADATPVAGGPGPADGGPDVVRLRPHRARVTAWILAVALVVLFALLGTALTGATGDGPGVFRRGDQLAMIGLGVLGALGALSINRVRVEADDRTVRVRNVVGSYDLPWEVVRAVRFDRGAAWASLELENDDLVSVLAVQAVDRERAVDAVRALRRLHATARSRPAG
jgi:hypothetical protein